jgi:hypothetical protein
MMRLVVVVLVLVVMSGENDGTFELDIFWVISR